MDAVSMEADVSFYPEEAVSGGLPVDLAAELLDHYQNSAREEDKHLCAAIGATAQAIRDQGLPPTPVAYFAATAASLDRLSRDPAAVASDPVSAALLVFLSETVGSVPTAVLRSKIDSVSETLLRYLGFGALPDVAVVAALKCAYRLIQAGDRVRWASVSQLYGVILGFVTDPRPKVRKEAHQLLSSSLLCFQRCPALVPACEGITSTFERFLLLAGGSKAGSSNQEEGPRGAMEVLYILNALKDCIHLMSKKSSSIVLKYCKPLLELRQAVVTRAVMEILQNLCLRQNSEVDAERLLEVLCSLAVSVTDQVKSGDEMASIARLLDAGVKKVYVLKREACVLKLPVIFAGLGDILATEHEEAIFAASEALKGLIYSCIDQSLVDGAAQAKLKLKGGLNSPGLTTIERICSTLDGFLGYRYSAVWDRCFLVISATLDKLGESSTYLMAGTIKGLAEMQNLSDDNFSYRKELHQCVGYAVRVLGPEAFLNLLPLNLDKEYDSDTNVWLLPILKQSIVGARLSFFSQHILEKIRLIQQKSLKSAEEGRFFSARSSEGLVYSLWSLLPAFCNYPVDTSSSFKHFQSLLCSTLRQEPELRGIICSSLQILIRQNNGNHSEISSPSDHELSNAERKARDYYTPEVREKNLKVIISSTPEYLATLSDVLVTSSQDSGGWLQSTIHEFASIPGQRCVRDFFVRVMRNLLKVTLEANKVKQSQDSSSMQVDNASNEASLLHRRALLLDVAVSLLPGLGKQEIGLLLKAIEPAFKDEDGLVQKKAYKALSSILSEALPNEINLNGNDREVKEFLSDNLDSLLELMIAALPFCHFSAKRHRLDALYFLIVYICKDSSEQRKRDAISSFLTEIILALKEANKKTRNRAYDLLVEIGHACGDEENGGRKENLLYFFNIVAGGLAGETPHMISAAVKGLARLAYEFSDLIGAAYNLLPSAFLLLQRQNREVVKANLGLMKVLVTKSKADGLQMHLKGIVEGLLRWQDNTKNHFKAKIFQRTCGHVVSISCLTHLRKTAFFELDLPPHYRMHVQVKLLIEMLVRKCGLDAVKAVMPEEHMKLLTNIRKIKERKERKAKSEADSESLHSRTTVSRQSGWNHTRIFSDFGGDDDDSDANIDAKTLTGRWSKASRNPGTKAASLRSKRTRQAFSKSLPEDLDQLEDDPLDLLDRQRTRSALHSSSAALKRKPESCDQPEVDPEGRLIIHEGIDMPKKQKNNSSGADSDARSHMRGHSSANSLARSQKKRQKTDSGWAYTGNEYTSKKAGGDIKRKNKLEPYAYWPLDRKLLNRRSEHKVAARKGMASVLKLTKKYEGKSTSSALAIKGTKSKKKHKGSNKSK